MDCVFRRRDGVIYSISCSCVNLTKNSALDESRSYILCHLHAALESYNINFFLWRKGSWIRTSPFFSRLAFTKFPPYEKPKYEFPTRWMYRMTGLYWKSFVRSTAWHWNDSTIMARSICESPIINNYYKIFETNFAFLICCSVRRNRDFISRQLATFESIFVSGRHFIPAWNGDGRFGRQIIFVVRNLPHNRDVVGRIESVRVRLAKQQHTLRISTVVLVKMRQRV